MTKEQEIIWDKKPAKVALPAATVSARVIALNEAAAAPLKGTETVCLGYSADKKTIYIKAFTKSTDKDLVPYPVKNNEGSLSIKCGKFIEKLELSLESRKRLKCAARVEDGMVVVTL